MRILVVCLGNICRSPLAERLLARRLAGTGAIVASAGLIARAGEPMQPHPAAELARLGGSPDGFGSRRLQASMAEQADLVLTATKDIRQSVVTEAPRCLKRIFTIPEAAALLPAAASALAGSAYDVGTLVSWAAGHRGTVDVAAYDVPDPIGQSADVHREVADLLDRDTSAIADVLRPLLSARVG